MKISKNLCTIVPVIVTGLGFAVGIGSLLRQTCTLSSLHCNQNENLNQTEYIAAVVEYKPIPIGSQTPVEAVRNNVQAYIKLMEDASHHNVDIIVFPEYGITTIALPVQRERAREYFVDVPEIGNIPCNESDFTSNHTGILYELSCAAKRYQMYVVVNLGEIDPCVDNADENCPPDGAYHYNTNVAFDRNGTIISRYRKFHLYFEPQFDYPELEYSTFQTDFGVEFGLFTCFDIIFAHPAVEMVASKGIRNFAFPTAWVDELPFLMAIQAQSLWAQSNKANLLASGYHQPDRGSMGSGIYTGYAGALDYVFDPNSGTRLIISAVPILPNVNADLSMWRKSQIPKKYDNADATNHFWLREDLSNCSHKEINFDSNSESLCYEDIFCCSIEYQLSSTGDAVGGMKLIAFDGRRTVAAKRDWFEWQVCAVVHCLNETLESCTEITDSPTNSSHISVQSLTIRMQPFKIEYETDGVAQPALSLLDTSFNLIPQTYFDIQLNEDENGLFHAQANTKNSTNIANVQIKTVALIQKYYSGRI